MLARTPPTCVRKLNSRPARLLVRTDSLVHRVPPLFAIHFLYSLDNQVALSF